MGTIYAFASEAGRVYMELAPWLLLGAIVAGFLHVVLPTGFVRRKLVGFKGVLTAVLVGLPLPLCSCGVIPAGLGLKKDGASDGATVAFMVSTPQTGVDSILVSAGFLGLPFAIFKVFSAALMGLLAGTLAEFRSEPAAQAPVMDTEDAHGSKWKAGVDHAVMVLRSIWGWVVFGILLSAAITSLLPAEVAQEVESFGPLFSSLIALVISIPLYVCATASVPVAAALVASGLPLGAALVFLMAGPATNVATIGAVYRTLGRRNLFVYLVVIVLGSLVLGVAFEHVLGHAAAGHAAHHMHSESIVEWLASGIMGLLLVSFAFGDIRRWLKGLRMESSTGVVKIQVGGMTCGGCSSRLTRVLEGLDGVQSAHVSLDLAQATIEGRVGVDVLGQAIRQAGFDVMEQPNDR